MDNVVYDKKCIKSVNFSQFNNSYKRDTVKQSSGGGSNLKVWGHMASAAREPIMGSGGGAPSGVQGQSPRSEGQGGEAP